MQGSIGGNTMSRTKGGSAARTRAKPTNKNSPAQAKAKRRLSEASAGWRALTDEQRQAWKIDAEMYPRVGVCGQPLQLTGQQHFVKVQATLGLYGEPSTDVPPEVDMVGFPPNMEDPDIGATVAFFGAADDFYFDITGLTMSVPLGAVAAEDDKFGIWASQPLSAGVKPDPKKLKFLTHTTLIASDIVTGSVDYGNSYVNTHGDVIGCAGKAVTITLRQFKESVQGFPCTMKTVIIES